MKSAFTLGVQAGDKAADAVVRPHYMQLRKLFASLMAGSYSRDVVEFAPVLRVDGSLWHWGREGVDNVRVSKKTAHATADIFVPISMWKENDAGGLRRYLGGQIAVAYELIAERIASARLDCDKERLQKDIALVVKEFLQ